MPRRNSDAHPPTPDRPLVDLSALPPEVAGHPALQWASAELARALDETGTPLDRVALVPARESGPEESFRLEPAETPAPPVVAAGDVRGFVYGLGEIADQVRAAPGPGFRMRAHAGRPATPVRGVMRLLTSEVEDERWFRDREFWSDYLDELARARVNRFTLGTGAGYDYFIDKDYRDLYFQFAYPFLVTPDGWDVRAEGLSEERRRENLELLRFIGAETRRRGISFRLGLWNHAWDCAPLEGDAPYRTIGLTAEDHAAYCRDALWTLLTACPEIEGVTFRVHFEGGVPEPTQEFWRVVLSRLESVDSLHEIDAHAKGVDDRLREAFATTGKRFSISTKFWAEHTGPPYHPASIRERERTPRPRRDSAIRAGGGADAGREVATTTTAARSFTRYGYADFLRDDRDYDVIYRIWPGSQRLLLWGDPETAAELGRIGAFGGARGWDWFEPLSLKGKKGSGLAGGRDLYRRPDLALGVADWRKYRYTIRLFGRLGYDPDAPAEVWRSVLREDHGDQGSRVEQALRAASRILPLITLAHAPSAAQNLYWPEMYTDVPLTLDPDPRPNRWERSGWSADGAFDTDGPYLFQNASSLDPELVYGIAEYAVDALAGRLDGRRTPEEVAAELDRLAATASEHAGERPDREAHERPQTARALIDAAISAGLGRFFAAKIRAATAFAIFEQTGRAGDVAAAIGHLRGALAAWDLLSEVAAVYHPDLTFGIADYSRGHWADRRGAMAADLARVIARAEEAGWDAATAADPAVAPPPEPVGELLAHDPDGDVAAGDDGLLITAQFTGHVERAEIRFRQVDQSQPWASREMVRSGDRWRGVIPADATSSPFAVQYYFRWWVAGAVAREPHSWGARLRQPYVVVPR